MRDQLYTSKAACTILASVFSAFPPKTPVASLSTAAPPPHASAEASPAGAAATGAHVDATSASSPVAASSPDARSSSSSSSSSPDAINSPRGSDQDDVSPAAATPVASPVAASATAEDDFPVTFSVVEVPAQVQSAINGMVPQLVSLCKNSKNPDFFAPLPLTATTVATAVMRCLDDVLFKADNFERGAASTESMEYVEYSATTRGTLNLSDPGAAQPARPFAACVIKAPYPEWKAPGMLCEAWNPFRARSCGNQHAHYTLTKVCQTKTKKRK